MALDRIERAQAAINYVANSASKAPKRSQTVEQVELDNAFNAVAEQRWTAIQTSGNTVPWDDAKAYLA